MSFIYEDDKLIKEFIRLAQATPTPAPAPTTPVPGNPADAIKIIDIAKELVKNLQIQFSGKDVFTAERDDAQLNTKNLINLDALLVFLQLNGIKCNGIEIVKDASLATIQSVPGSDNQTEQDKRDAARAEEAKKSGYYDYPPAPEKARYLVHKEGLEKYLRDLQSKNNRLLNVYISKLFDEINNKLKFAFSKVAPKAAPTAPAAPAKPGTPAAAPAAGTQSAAAQISGLKQLIPLFPLISENLDLSRVKEFVEYCKQIIPAEMLEINIINSIENDLREVLKYTTVTSRSIYLPQNPGNISILAANIKTLFNLEGSKKEDYYMPFLDAIFRVISGTFNLIKSLTSIERSLLDSDSNIKTKWTNAVSNQTSIANNMQHTIYALQSQQKLMPSKP